MARWRQATRGDAQRLGGADDRAASELRRCSCRRTALLISRGCARLAERRTTATRGDSYVHPSSTRCRRPPRSPATLPGSLAGGPPRNKGLRFPVDPPRVEEIIAAMREAGPGVPRRPCPRPSRRSMACGPSDQRGPEPGRGRPRPAREICASLRWACVSPPHPRRAHRSSSETLRPGDGYRPPHG
jgi:hypothetical protein